MGANKPRYYHLRNENVARTELEKEIKMIKILSKIKAIKRPKMTPFKAIVIALLIASLFPIAAIAEVITIGNPDAKVDGNLEVTGYINNLSGNLTLADTVAVVGNLEVGDSHLRVKASGATNSEVIIDGGSANNSYLLLRGNGTERVVLRRQATTHAFQISTNQGASYGFTMDTSSNVDIAGDLTVDGTIYGELAEDLVISAPAGYVVEIGADSTVELGTLRAVTGDTIEVDDNMEFQGTRTISATTGLVISTDTGSIILQDGDPEDPSVIVVDPDYVTIDGDAVTIQGDYVTVNGVVTINGVAEIGGVMEVAPNYTSISPYGFVEIETGYVDFIVNDVTKTKITTDGLWASDVEVFGDLDIGADLTFGAYMTMDETGITDSAGSFTVQATGGAADITLSGNDDAYLTSGDDVFLDGGSGGDVYVNLNGSTKLWIDDDGIYYAYVYGSAYANGSWVDGSDRRLKTNVVPVESLLDRIRQIDVVRYNSIDSGRDNIGIIAQDLDLIMKELVFCGDASEGGMCGISAYQLASVGVKGIQELYDLIQSLSFTNYDAQISALESQVATLETQVAVLEAGMIKLEARMAALETLHVSPMQTPEPEVTPESTVEPTTEG